MCRSSPLRIPITTRIVLANDDDDPEQAVMMLATTFDVNEQHNHDFDDDWNAEGQASSLLRLMLFAGLALLSLVVAQTCFEAAVVSTLLLQHQSPPPHAIQVQLVYPVQHQQHDLRERKRELLPNWQGSVEPWRGDDNAKVDDHPPFDETTMSTVSSRHGRRQHQRHA